MTFLDVVLKCAGIPEFVAEFNRLMGCQLTEPRSRLSEMIDEATGWEKEQLRRFVAFVAEVVWLPLHTGAA